MYSRKRTTAWDRGCSSEKESAASSAGSRWNRRRFSYLMRRKVAPIFRALNKTWSFQIVMFCALFSALFMPDIWILADIASPMVLDVILTIVLFAFLLELVVQSIGSMRTYLWSFFFYMDVLGALSLLLDLSYVGIVSGNEALSENVVVMRAARIAKLGARAGRFTRLVKLLRYIPGLRENYKDEGTATAISGRLVNSLSTRVSCLVIIMVMFMPVFSMWSFPTSDLSIDTWLDVLEKTSVRQPDQLGQKLVNLDDFYNDLSYYPYSIYLKSGSSLVNSTAGAFPWTSSRSSPQRPSNTVRQESDNFVLESNFTGPHQIDSWMNILLLIVIMIVMLSFSLVLSNSVSSVVLLPLENMLTQVRKMASTIFSSVSNMAATMKPDGVDEDDDDEGLDGGGGGGGFSNETNLLEKVVQKLAILGDLSKSKRHGNASRNPEGLDEDDIDVVNKFQGISADASMESESTSDAGDESGEAIEEMRRMEEIQKVSVAEAGLSLDLLNSWSMNPLELDKARNHVAAMYFVGHHNHGLPIDPDVMGHFLEEAEAGYLKTCPYHNWFHAIDVAHCAWRLISICYGDIFFSGVERYALIVSALCHDIGHPGLDNAFLIETKHPLALMYNDKSPLENMHCSKLFELASRKDCQIFGELTDMQYQAMRRNCVDAILFTDNALHFKMMKAAQLIYEVNSDEMVISRERYAEDPDSFPTDEALEVFRLPETRRLLMKLFLRLADMSNSIKPFRICRIWAWQQLEELFLQGDQEKELGMPVQALHNREKADRAYSQVAFIEFLACPLLFVTCKLMPPSEPFIKQVLQNLKTWLQHWKTETKPPPTPAQIQALQDRMLRLQNMHADLACVAGTA